ncbi:hypothetical protein [Erysiphe necator associated sobemo-like virus 3]|nr:hypothetical protein [Erysiphe necator associated sobemo-like virus 3]
MALSNSIFSFVTAGAAQDASEQTLSEMRAEVARLKLELAKSQRIPIMDGFKALVSSVRNIPLPGFVAERTRLELSLLALGAGYAAWQLSRSTYVGRFTSSAAGGLLPGWNKFREWTGRCETVISRRAAGSGVVLESRRPGSEESPLTIPDYQATVGFFSDGKFEVLGAVVRFANNMLVGPDHVLNDSIPLYVKGRQNQVSIHGKRRIVLDTDLVAIPMTDAELSKIGISVARISDFRDDSSAMAYIVGPMGVGTTGKLFHDSTIFGRVIYKGTTKPGYSGAAYSIGSALAGIHCHGGNENGGFAASYVWALLSLNLKIYVEDSPKWLLAQFEAGNIIEWQHAGDPDWVTVKINGKYNNVTSQAMYDTFGGDWHKSSKLRRSKRNSYEDYELESTRAIRSDPNLTGEVRNSKNPGASSSVVGIQEPEQLDLQQLTHAYKNLSRQQKKQFHSWQTAINSRKGSTITPENSAK